jgi:phospholipase C
MTHRTTRSLRFLTLGLLLAVLVAGCSPGASPATKSVAQSAPSGSVAQKRPPAPVAPAATRDPNAIAHVVIIVEENKPAAQIIGNNAAPYINALSTDFAVSDNYRAIAHPSLPNYLALTSGTTAGIATDCIPAEGDCLARVLNITDEIVQSGRTWKLYAEGMPAPCTAANTGVYAVRHNPFLYYPDVTNDNAYCVAHDVPFTRLSADLRSAASLPNYVFISPNLCNDMHDCTVKAGDAWLARQAKLILASPAFTTQKSLLVITWDEGDTTSNKVVALFAGPAAKTVYRSDRPYTHYSLLHTIETAWGLAPLTANDRDAPVMSELLQ